MSIAELLATDHLGLTLMAGHGGVGRRVLWTHVSEIEDTADWLDGGELLLTTGLGIPDKPSGQVTYVRRLAEVGAAGLGIGQRSPQLDEAMLAEADRLDLPILRVDVDVPFLAISRLVAASNTDAAQSRIATQLRIYDSLRSRVEQRRSLPDLFAHLGDIAGYDLFVVSEKGRSLFPDLADAPEDLRPRIPDLSDRSPALPEGVGVPIPLAGRTAAYLLAIERDCTPAGLGAIRHIATVAALELANLYRDRAEALQRGAEALADLLGGQLGAQQAERALLANGLEAGRPLFLAAVKSRKPQERPRPGELHHHLRDAGIPAMVLGRSEVLFLLTHDAECAGVSEALDASGLHAGLSKPFTDPLAVTVARMEAMWAAQWPTSLGDDPTTRFEASSGWMTWLPHEVGALARIIDHTLAPIRAYDAENGTELVHTLRVFFRTERNIGRAAEELFIHKHTLQYRLRRIREISGRSMARTQDLAELWFAFQAEALIRAAELEPEA